MDANDRKNTWINLEDEIWEVETRWKWLHMKSKKSCEKKGKGSGFFTTFESLTSDGQTMRESSVPFDSSWLLLEQLCGRFYEAVKQTTSAMTALKDLLWNRWEDENICESFYDAQHFSQQLLENLSTSWSLCFSLFRAQDLDLLYKSEKLASLASSTHQLGLKFIMSCWKTYLAAHCHSHSTQLNHARTEAMESGHGVGLDFGRVLTAAHAFTISVAQEFQRKIRSEAVASGLNDQILERNDNGVSSRNEELMKYSKGREWFYNGCLFKASNSSTAARNHNTTHWTEGGPSKFQKGCCSAESVRTEPESEPVEGKGEMIGCTCCCSGKPKENASPSSTEDNNGGDTSCLSASGSKRKYFKTTFQVHEWQILRDDLSDLQEEWQTLSQNLQSVMSKSIFSTIAKSRKGTNNDDKSKEGSETEDGDDSYAFLLKEFDLEEKFIDVIRSTQKALQFASVELEEQMRVWKERESQNELNLHQKGFDPEEALSIGKSLLHQLMQSYFAVMLLTSADNCRRVCTYATLLPESMAESRKYAYSLVLARETSYIGTERNHYDIINPHVLCQHLAMALCGAHALCGSFVGVNKCE